MSMSEVSFVNYAGQPVSTAPVQRKVIKREQPDAFHRGWRVEGVPPGALESAKAGHEREIEAAVRHNEGVGRGEKRGPVKVPGGVERRAMAEHGKNKASPVASL